MSPIDGIPGSLPPIVQDLLIAENIGEIVDASGLAGQDSGSPAPPEIAPPAGGNLGPSALALSLAGLTPPQAGFADLDPAAVQSFLGKASGDSASTIEAKVTHLPVAPVASHEAAASGPQLAMGLDAAQGTLNALQHLAGNPALQPDSGIIPSFILNAGMIPGLQQQPQNSAAGLPAPAAGAPPDDDQALTYLANLGANEALLEKLRKMLKKKVPGKRLLVGLAALMTAVSVVSEALARELKTAAEDRRANEEARLYAESRGHRGRRRHLYLE